MNYLLQFLHKYNIIEVMILYYNIFISIFYYNILIDDKKRILKNLILKNIIIIYNEYFCFNSIIS